MTPILLYGSRKCPSHSGDIWRYAVTMHKCICMILCTELSKFRNLVMKHNFLYIQVHAQNKYSSKSCCTWVQALNTTTNHQYLGMGGLFIAVRHCYVLLFPNIFLFCKMNLCTYNCVWWRVNLFLNYLYKNILVKVLYELTLNVFLWIWSM